MLCWVYRVHQLLSVGYNLTFYLYQSVPHNGHTTFVPQLQGILVMFLKGVLQGFERRVAQVNIYGERHEFLLDLHIEANDM
jgi:hypothetical protein